MRAKGYSLYWVMYPVYQPDGSVGIPPGSFFTDRGGILLGRPLTACFLPEDFFYSPFFILTKYKYSFYKCLYVFMREAQQTAGIAFSLGKAYTVREGRDITIFAEGGS
jgi:hypothetical protein